MPIDSLVVIRKGGNPNEQGTWIHQSLIVAFARWLSPDFAVWCDMTIEEILKSQTIQPQTQNLQLPEIENSTQKIIELDNNFIATTNLLANLRNTNPIDLFRLEQYFLANFRYSILDKFKIDLENQFFLPTELGKMINKSPVEINLILAHKGFQIRENKIWKLTESGRDFGIEINGKFIQIKWKMRTVL